MTLPVVWLPEADADLKQARAWYNNVRSALGERFAYAVEETVETISEGPLQFPVVHRTLRRAGVRRFPFGIFFEAQESKVTVMACLHGRRDPRRWKVRG
jgi:plasmid stabilization system protein ParE